MNSYHILMLLENNPYPSDTRVRMEARSLADAGYRVAVICPRENEQPWQETLSGVDVYRYPAPPESNTPVGYLFEYGYSLIVVFMLTWYVFFRRGFEIIHSHNPPDIFVFIALVFKLLGKRYVFDHHDLSPEVYRARQEGDGNALIHNALIAVEKLSCRVASHVIATNESYKQLEIERSGISPDKVTIVRNAPDFSRLTLLEPDPELVRSGKTLIGYAGVMGYQDGLDYLLRALKHLAVDLERPDFICYFLGSGAELENLKQLAAELGITENVVFAGWLNGAELSRHLSSMDICVDPDPSNPFNDRSTMIKMMEYMAFGKPIVAFDLPEHRYTAQEAALYVADNNELEFARAIERLMDDPKLCAEMSQFGQARIAEGLNWECSAANLISVYDSLLPDAATLPDGNTPSDGTNTRNKQDGTSKQSLIVGDNPQHTVTNGIK